MLNWKMSELFEPRWTIKKKQKSVIAKETTF